MRKQVYHEWNASTHPPQKKAGRKRLDGFVTNVLKNTTLQSNRKGVGQQSSIEFVVKDRTT